MISFCIKNNNNQVIDNLLGDISEIDLDNVLFSKKDFSKYTNIILHYTGKNSSEFYSEFSNMLCEFIIRNYEAIIVRNLLYLNYFYFDYMEIGSIEKICAELLSTKEFLDRKMCLWTDILKYVTENKSMVLDGFVLFRASDYIKYIDEAIDMAVNQFVIDKEYFDFINLLKLYISTKTSEAGLVHLIYINGESILLDEEKNVITISKSSLNIGYLSDISFSSNDYTLNSLLTLLPNKIIMHLIAKEDEFINTLKLIFEDKIEVCADCNICQTYRLFQAK